MTNRFISNLIVSLHYWIRRWRLLSLCIVYKYILVCMCVLIIYIILYTHLKTNSTRKLFRPHCTTNIVRKIYLFFFNQTYVKPLGSVTDLLHRNIFNPSCLFESFIWQNWKWLEVDHEHKRTNICKNILFLFFSHAVVF